MPRSRRERLAERIGPAALALAFAGLAAWSWGKWTDVHIDFGVELYIPWQIREGAALYRDIAYRNGPLSPYWNALLFWVFGTSLRTLVVANLVVLAGLTAMLWMLFRRACGPVVATATGLVFLGVFAFGQYVGIGNFNYVTPYHHAQTHGLVLSVALIACLAAAVRRPTAVRSAAAGLCLGLVLLTKAEIAGPATATAAVGALMVRRTGVSGTGRLALAFGGAALVPGALFAVGLATAMPAGEAVRGVLGNWGHLGAALLSDRFYLEGAGLTRAPENLAAALRAFAGIALAVALAVGADRWLPTGPRRGIAGAAAGALVFALLVAEPDLVPWERLARALPLTTLAILAWLAIAERGSPADAAWRERRVPLLLWAVFSLLLLAKMLLYARFGQYGFVLAMPATLLLVAFLLRLPPRLLGAGPGAGTVAHALLGACVAAGVVYFVSWSDDLYAMSRVAVGEGGDRILVSDPRGTAVNRALRELSKVMGPDSTLVVLPEGASLNYWLRRRNPTRFLLFLPTELAAFGEQTMLDDLRASPPDFVALVHRRPDESGVGPFGSDPRNGQKIGDWVRENYRRLGRIGAEPFGRRFGIVLLQRREPDSP